MKEHKKQVLKTFGAYCLLTVPLIFALWGLVRILPAAVIVLCIALIVAGLSTYFVRKPWSGGRR